MPQTIKGLTFNEFKEAHKLKKEIFKGTNFVLFTEGLLDTKEVKRYMQLMSKKVTYIKQHIIENN